MASPFFLALFHWLLGMLLQTENFLIYLTARGKRTAALAPWCSLLPRLQSEYLLVAGLVGGLALLALPSLVGRWLLFACYTALTLFLVAGQLYYKHFFDHFRPSVFASIGHSTLRNVMHSVRHQLDRAFWINVLIAVGFLAWLAWSLAAYPATMAAGFSLSALLLQAGIFLALFGLSAATAVRQHGLERHPLVILLQDMWRKRLAPAGASGDKVLPEPAHQPSLDAHQTGAVDALRLKFRKPNVILVVLESVGTLQLLDPFGNPSAEVTPHLAELARHALLFDTVYSVFPFTSRNYVALEMGGAYPTSESNWAEAVCRYPGITLPKHFAAHGYRTGYFTPARLFGDTMLDLVQTMGYDTIAHFSPEIERADPSKIHLWGSLESSTLDRIEPWIEERRRAGNPFFLTYFTCATHHPYGAPLNYAAPFAGDDILTRYRNSLHYTDAMLHRLVEFLRQHDLWDNTIVALTGDHGEAFGTVRPTNWAHGAYIYEENIRSFLLFLNSGTTNGPVVISRPSSSGDILSTLADVAGLSVPEVPGTTLCSRQMPPRFIFFFTLFGPGTWGLRDGKWKFVQTFSDLRPELYDLSIDPNEQTNLAGQHPERIRGYTLRCQEWFQTKNERFCAT